MFHQGLIVQLTISLFFAAYVAFLNILAVFNTPVKKVYYSTKSILLIIFLCPFMAGVLEAFFPFSNLYQTLSFSLIALVMSFVTLTVVFIKERTLQTIGLSLDGIRRGIIIGLVVGYAECLFFGNFNPCGEMGISDIEAGEILLIAPLFEEVFFRGFLHRCFRLKGKTAGISVIYTSLIWTVLHFYSFEASCFLFLSGMLLGCVRVKTKSLVAPMIMHTMWNFFVM